MKEPKLNFNAVRSEEQRSRMEKAKESLLCPFCEKGLIEIHQKEIFYENNSWLVTESAFPYDGTEHHYLIVSKRHVSSISDLSPTEWSDQGEAIKYLVSEKKIDGGSMFLRFGDMKKTGSSIEHLHVHVLSGNADENMETNLREPIRVKLGYKKVVSSS